MRKIHLYLLATATFLMACKGNTEHVPTQVEIRSQMDIVGNQATLVRPDSVSIVVIRDSVPNEETDTIYKLKTSITLILDSTFMADKMEDNLQLHICDIIFEPIDGSYKDNLITFMKSGKGSTVDIDLVGKAERNKFLQLSNESSVLLKGFSFRKIDPEAMADPKITKMLDSYAKWLRIMKKDMDENYGILPQTYVHQGLPEAYELYQKLESQESIMTPKQKERFAGLLKLHKSIDFPE